MVGEPPLVHAQRAAEGRPAATASPSASAVTVAPYPVQAPTSPIARPVAPVAAARARTEPARTAPPAPAGATAPIIGLRALGVQRLPDTEVPERQVDEDGWPLPLPPPAPRPPDPIVTPLSVSGITPSSKPAAPAPVPVRRHRPAQRMAADEAPGDTGGAPKGVQRAPEKVPADLAQAVGAATGTNVSDVPIHRGPESDEAAKSMSAKAFASEGEVHLPERHGSLAGGEGKAIAAHELAHIAQQKEFGSSLPPEDTPAGQALEQEAKEVAGAVTGKQRLPESSSAAAAPPLEHARASRGSASTGSASVASAAQPLPRHEAVAVARRVQASALGTGVARPSGGGLAFAPPTPFDDGGPVRLGVQRVPAGVQAWSSGSPSEARPRRGGISLGSQRQGGGGGSTTSLPAVQTPPVATMSAPPADVPAPATPPPPPPAAPADVPAPATPPSPPPDLPPALAEATSGEAGEEGMSDAQVAALEKKLYPLIRRRLAKELLVERERAGRLHDRR
jgi:hypothetical protein